MKTSTRHKTHSSQTLATLLLPIYTAISRMGGMHTENAQVHTFVSLLLWRLASVKCVRPAFEMEVSKEEQRDVVRFLVAEGAVTRHKAKTPWKDVGRNHPFA